MSTPATVPVSEELFAPVGGDVELCYQTFGSDQDEPMLLVMGLGGPMIWFDEEFCRRIAAEGFYVIRFDNRDIGRSTKMQGRVTRGTLVKAFAGAPVNAPYSLEDMAKDSFGLLDHLGIESAHIVGVSMGGMIVQTMAIMSPRRVRSVTSIMSTTGQRRVGWIDPRVMPKMLAKRAETEDAYADMSANLWKVIGSHGYPTDPEVSRDRAVKTFRRGISASGTLRQMLAIMTQPNRAPRLHSLSMPALVVHGDSDRLVHVSGGRATAAAIPGAELLVLRDMGHDLPEGLWTPIIAAIVRVARSADR